MVSKYLLTTARWFDDPSYPLVCRVLDTTAGWLRKVGL